MPSGLYKARTGQVVAQTGPEQEILSLPGMYFFDGWRVHPTLPISDHLPRAREAPVLDIAQTAPTPGTEPTRSPEEEARDIPTAAKNQPEVPVISSDLTSELLHCLSTLPDPWPQPRSPWTWRNRASGSQSCADSTLPMNTPGEQSDCPHPRISQILRLRSERSDHPLQARS